MLDISKLNYEERVAYNNLLEQAKVRQITPDDFKNYLQGLIFATVEELVETPTIRLEKNISLKARIKNYLLQYKILVQPERVAEQMNKAVKEFERKIEGDKTQV